MQVSVNCVERGRLMADLWTSNAELTGRLLTDLINQKDASERAMMAMQQDNQELQNELDSLRMKLKHKEAEQQEASRRLKALEGLAVKYKYRGESWEEQEAEWQKLEEVRAKERENYKPEARAGGSDGGKPGSFFMSARLKAMKADEG